MLFDPKECIEIRVLGPEGKPFIELERKYIELFKKHNTQFLVPRLFSAPTKTTVVINIGVGVIIGVATYLVTQFIDDVFSIHKAQPNTEITINIHNGDNYISIEGDKENIIKKIKEINKSNISKVEK